MIKLRDVRSIEIIYNHYAAVLYGVIYKITGDEKKSEAVLFKTFTHIWNHYEELDENMQQACLWMLNISRYFCFETMDREERMRVESTWLQNLNSQSAGKFEMLGLVFFGGMSIIELGEKFSCSTKVVRMQLHESMNDLKKEYFVK